MCFTGITFSRIGWRVAGTVERGLGEFVAVGVAQAKMLEEDARSRRNCRHVYSLLAGSAGVEADIT